MKKLILIGAVLCGTAVVAKDLVLVEDGVAKATVVIPKGAIESNKKAANELVAFVERMSGAKLPVVTDDKKDIAGPKVLIGANRFVKDLGIEIPQGYSLKEIKEGYWVKRVGDDLVLAGNDGDPGEKKPVYRGTLFAVYDFLFDQGCRWYMPGAFGEVIPTKKTIAVGDVSKFVKPAFLKHGYWQKQCYRNKSLGIDGNKDHAEWFDRNRFIAYGALYDNSSDGSIMKPFRARKMTNETHPEYFGLNKDGTRAKNHLCMTNPDVERILVEDALEHFRQNPESRSVGYAPPDGLPVCYCPDCIKANGDLFVLSQWDCSLIPCVSGSYYKLMDKVARAVEKEFPDKVVVSSVYAGRIMPPAEYWKMPSNAAGFCAFIEYTLMHPIDDPDNWESAQIRSLLSSWKTRLDMVTYRPYHPCFLVNLALPIPLYDNTIRDVKWLHKNKLQGYVWEGWPGWGTDLLGYYLRSRMLWEPEADGAAIVAEFYDTFYGKAAQPVRKFYDALEKAVTSAPFNSHEAELFNHVYNWKLVSSLMPLVAEAERLTADADEATKLHVRMFRLQAEQVAAFSEMRDDAERNYDYARAAKLAQVMVDREDEMLNICPCWFYDGHRGYDKARLAKDPFNGNFTAWGKREQYKAIAKLADGTLGKMIRPLPETWKLKTDVIQEGTAAQWYVPETDISKWEDVKIGTTLELQGHYSDKRTYLPFKGDAWFAVDFDADGDFDPAHVGLFCGGINNQAWIWLNGEKVGYYPFHAWWSRGDYTKTFKLPPNALKKGRNRLTVRCVCGDIYGFGGIFRGMFLYEDMDRDPVRIAAPAEVRQIAPAAVQMLPHGSISGLEADGNRLDCITGWTRGFGVLTYDMTDPKNPKLTGGTLMPGFVEGRDKSKDGKYMYVATMYGFTVLEKTATGWNLKRDITIDFSPSEHAGKQPIVDGDRMLLVGNRTKRLYDISKPDEPVLVKMDYVPQPGEFQRKGGGGRAPANVVAACPPEDKKARTGGIIDWKESGNRGYALIRNAEHDVYVFDKAGAKIGEFAIVSNDGAMEVTDKAAYCLSNTRLYWYDLEKLGQKITPDGFADIPELQIPKGRIYNFLTAGLKAEGEKLVADTLTLDLGGSRSVATVSVVATNGAPFVRAQTGTDLLARKEADGALYELDKQGAFLIRDAKSGETLREYKLDAPCTLEIVNGFVYVPCGITRADKLLYVYDMKRKAMTKLAGLVRDGIGVSAVGENGHLFLGDGLVVREFDLADPLAPKEVADYVGGGEGYLEEPYTDATQLLVRDNRLYCKRYSRINVWNLK